MSNFGLFVTLSLLVLLSSSKRVCNHCFSSQLLCSIFMYLRPWQQRVSALIAVKSCFRSIGSYIIYPIKLLTRARWCCASLWATSTRSAQAWSVLVGITHNSFDSFCVRVSTITVIKPVCHIFKFTPTNGDRVTVFGLPRWSSSQVLTKIDVYLYFSERVTEPALAITRRLYIYT